MFETFVKGERLFDCLDDLFKNLYNFAADDFDREVSESVFVVAFGQEISMSIEEFYQFDREFATEAWRTFVGDWIRNYILEGGYKSDYDESVIEKIDTLIHRFIEWLRTLDHDKLDAELVTKLLTGEASERDIALGGLAEYLSRHFTWRYPI